jgi:hypothetical protein
MQNQRKNKVVKASVHGTAGPKEDRHFVTALARGLDVLGAFRPQDQMLGNMELARRSALPKSTVSRLTYTHQTGLSRAGAGRQRRRRLPARDSPVW